MEQQEIPFVIKVDTTLAQGIKTMMYQVAIVLSSTKVAGGIIPATVQTSIVSTMVECYKLVHRDIIAPSNSLRSNRGKVRVIDKIAVYL